MAGILRRGIFVVQLLLLSIFTLAAAAADKEPELSSIIPGAYIVEFADLPNNHANVFYSDLSAEKILAKPRMTLSSSLFKGASFHLGDSHDVRSNRRTIEQISALKSVKKVFPMRKYSLPYEVISTGDGSAMASRNEGIQKRISFQDEEEYDLSIHGMTGVDKLREEGYTGTDIKVAIVDTGIDYLHPDLGGCFGLGCKVGFGYDLVGDDYTGDNEPVPDSDPYDNCGGHGTHVAGIIAASANEQDYFTGVAPNVTLGAYRVMGCGGGVANDVLLQAFMMAFESGADIITSSLGGGGGWSEEALDVLVSRIVAAGVPCTVSAGNSGMRGPFSSSTPAGAIGATAVGSVDNEMYPMILVPGKYFSASGTDTEFGWMPGTLTNISNGIYPLYALSYNTSIEDDACHDPPLTGDLSEFIVLIRRGGCSFSRKAGNAAARGAKHVLFYNSEPGVDKVNVYAPGMESAGMVPEYQGKAWINQLRAGLNVYLSIVPPEYAGWTLMEGPNTLTGGYMSTFSSWGPSFETRNKPQISAPGGLIASTYPLDKGGYAVLSGTSMSCPFVAGAIALILEARGKLSPEEINSLLSNTAEPATFHDGKRRHTYLAPIAQQGGGLINVHNAVHATTLLNVSDISFNDTEHLPQTTGFTIKNTGPNAVTYEIGHTPSATFYTFGHGGSRSTFKKGQPPAMLHLSADLAFSVSEATVQPDESVSIDVSPKTPSGLTSSRVPVYGGYITVNSTGGESLSLPYSGVDSPLRNAPILNRKHVYLSSTIRPGYPWASNYRFPLPPPNSTRAKYPNILAPAVYIEMAMGSPLLRIDIQPADRSHRFKYNTTTVLGEEILGGMSGFPSTYVPSAPIQGGWHGQMADGSYAPPGNYTFLVRALKIFGDPEKVEDYESVRTDPFGIWYG